MRQSFGCRILEAEDLAEGVTLEEVNRELKEEDLQTFELLDTRFMAVDPRIIGYNSNIMVYSGNVSQKVEDDAASLLSDYFEQDRLALNCLGYGAENYYYEIASL